MLKTPQSDNFDGGPMMTFGEHLEELRVVLIRALMGVLICIVIGFVAAKAVVRFIQSPLEDSLQSFYLQRSLNELAESYRKQGKTVPAEMVNIIVHEKLAPKFVKVEPQSFLGPLRPWLPGVEEVKSTAGGFVVEDVVHSDFMVRDKKPQFVRLAKRLSEPGNDAALKALHDALSEDERALMARVAASTEEKVADADKQEIVAALNRIVGIPEFSEREGLSDFQPADGPSRPSVNELRETVKAGSASTEDRLRLNKLVLSGVLSDSLRPPRLRLIELMEWEPITVRVQSLGAQEAFMIYMKASFVFGFALSLPWIAYQIWLFVASGLYPHEKKYIYVFLPISGALFLAGASLAFFFVFKPVLEFLFFFNEMLNINPDPRMGDWMGFVLLLPLGFGISFQLPLVMLFLNRLGIVTAEVFIEHWRAAILVIFVLAMMLTPGGDPYSMLFMAVPLCGLYVLGIALCKWLPRSRNPFPDAYEP